MDSHKIVIEVEEMPDDGLVMMLGSYNPSFWMNQRPDKFKKIEIRRDSE